MNASLLGNSGESLTIANALGGTRRTFVYDDSAPWPVAPDGSGPSLVLINPASNPDHPLASNWRATNWSAAAFAIVSETPLGDGNSEVTVRPSSPPRTPELRPRQSQTAIAPPTLRAISVGSGWPPAL